MHLEVQGHTVPHLKALRYGIYETRGLSCGSTSSICKCTLKSGNLPFKRGFVRTLLLRTVPYLKASGVDDMRQEGLVVAALQASIRTSAKVTIYYINGALFILNQ